MKLKTRWRSAALGLLVVLVFQIPDSPALPAIGRLTSESFVLGHSDRSLAVRFAPQATAAVVRVASDFRELTYEAVLKFFPIGSTWRLADVVAPDGRFVFANLKVTVLSQVHRVCGALPEANPGTYALHFQSVDGLVVRAYLRVWASIIRGQYRALPGDAWGSDCRHVAAS